MRSAWSPLTVGTRARDVIFPWLTASHHAEAAEVLDPLGV